MALLTHLSPTAGLPGAGYGSFASKVSGAHAPDPLTQLSPTGGVPGGLYGSFGGKTPSTVPLTQLSPTAGVPGGLYGLFSGKEASGGVVPKEPFIGRHGGLRFRGNRPEDVESVEYESAIQIEAGVWVDCSHRFAAVSSVVINAGASSDITSSILVGSASQDVIEVSGDSLSSASLGGIGPESEIRIQVGVSEKRPITKTEARAVLDAMAERKPLTKREIRAVLKKLH